MTSDECLKESGFKKLVDTLSGSKEARIVIIGGSHSAFSVAWLLLYGPS